MELIERISIFTKNAEFYVPTKLIRPLKKVVMLRVNNPYHEENDKFKCIFIHIPKTAGTSVTKALFDTDPLHIPLSRFALFDKNKFERYFKFCFVRNSWARIFSEYNHIYRLVGDDIDPDSRWASHYLSETPSFEIFIFRMENRKFRPEIKKIFILEISICGYLIKKTYLVSALLLWIS